MFVLQPSTESKTTKPTRLPAVPWSWYYAGPLRRLLRGPLGVSLGTRRFVIYRTADQRLVALDGRCVHMGADLASGEVEGNCLRCPFHGWAFDPLGKCVDIPAAKKVPEIARVQGYPTAELGGHVFFFNQPTATFAMPFFDGLEPGDLFSARPFDFEADLPWYLVGANGFDGQHFRAAHDRQLIDEPVVSRPAAWAYRVSCRFAVVGNTWRDRATRRFSGPELRMTVTSWNGTILLVTAEFARTTSYGMVCVRPLTRERSHVVDIVSVRRRAGVAGRVFNPLDAALRRSFIRAFVRDDQRRSSGVRLDGALLIPADGPLMSYVQWLGSTTEGDSLGGTADSHGCMPTQ